MRKFATIQTHEQTIQTLKDLCAVYGSNNWFSKVLIRLLKFCKRDPMKFWHRSTEMNTIKKRTSAKEFRIMGYKVDRSRKKKVGISASSRYDIFAKKINKLNINFSTLALCLLIFCKSLFQLNFFSFMNHCRCNISMKIQLWEKGFLLFWA